MAQKRMFDKTITNSDEFIEMPISCQVLYFHLSMNADDDGFVNNWKSIMRMIGTKEDDLKVLIAKQFIIPFESGVIVIKHWRINNFLRKDRHNDTKFQKELSMLGINESQEYVWLTSGQPSIDKNRLDKNSIDKNIYGEFKNVKLTDEEYEKLKEANLLPYIEKLSSYIASKGKKYKSHYATILNWSGKEQKITPNWFDKEQEQQELTDEEKKEFDDLCKLD